MAPRAPAAPGMRSRKYAQVTSNIYPLRLAHPPTGLSVYLNTGGTPDELRRYAHALLAARLGPRT